MKIEKCEPIYTGGGIYCFLGQLSNHEWFMASDGEYDVMILDADPWAAVDPVSGDDLCWFYEWQEPHLVKQLDDDESLEFFENMLMWVKENEPKGNYLMSDLEWVLDEVLELKGTTNWR